MTIPVPIDSLAEELDAIPEDATVYLHRETGEFLLVLDHDLGIIEEGLESEEEFEWPWEGDDLAKLHEIVSTSRWVRLPSKFDIHDWSIMQHFAYQVPEPLSSRLQDAIHGRGAFRMFRAVLEMAGELDAWYDFKHEHLVGLAAEALEAEKIPFKRNRRPADITKSHRHHPER